MGCTASVLAKAHVMSEPVVMDKLDKYRCESDIPANCQAETTQDGEGPQCVDDWTCELGHFRPDAVILDRDRSKVPKWKCNVTEQEFSDDECVEEAGNTSTFCVLLSEAHQAQLTQTHQELADAGQDLRTQQAFTHLYALGLQLDRIQMLAAEAGMGETRVTLAEWLRVFECIAQDEGGDFFISILLTQSSRVLTSRRNRKHVLRLFHEVDVASSGWIPRGAAAEYFATHGAPQEFMLKYEVMEDMFCDTEERDEVNQEAWVDIFESLLANEGTCDWLIKECVD